jgi:hypothetical protein
MGPRRTPGTGSVANTVRVGGRYVTQDVVHHAYRGVRMRSRYETNYAAFLDYLGIPWQYEPRKFIFAKIVSGTRVYVPDFYLPKVDEYHETKGYMDRKSRTKLKWMKIYFPTIKVILIDQKFFASIERQRLCRVIPSWRCRHTMGEANAVLQPKGGAG